MHQRPDEGPLAERLQKVLDRATADGLPGAALAVRGDRVQFTGVSGVAAIDNALPLTTNHRFYLASIGKPYTAVVLVRLAADGLLGLDDPITRWLPTTVTDRIPSSGEIPVRSLLAHTSGSSDFKNDGSVGKAWEQAFVADSSRVWTNTDVLSYVVDKPLHFEPGTACRYSYSN